MQQPGFYIPGPPSGHPSHVQQSQQQQQQQYEQQQQPHMMPQAHASSAEMGGGGAGGGGGFGGGLANIGLGLYGAEKAQQWFNNNNSFLSKSASNVAILSSSVKYYFDIDNNYVVAKLRAVLVPFLNKNWERIPEQVAGGVTYKSGRQDVNAPDLYICSNGFVTYVLIVLFSHLASPAAAAATSSSGFALFSSTAATKAANLAAKAAAPDAPLVNGGTKVLSPTLASRAQATASKVGGGAPTFNPDSMNIILWRSAMTWVFNFIVLRVALYMTNSNIKAALLDLAAYSGYLFVYGSLCRLAGIFSSSAGMLVWLYMSAAYGLFLTKTMQRVMVLESRNYGVHVRQNNYVLMAVAIMQFVLLKWLMM